MQKIILPHPPYNPFSSEIHTLVKEAEAHTDQFLLKYDLVPIERLDYYRGQGFAYMVARMFPNCEFKALCVFTDLNSVLFLIDDLLDHREIEDNKSTRDVQFLVLSILKIFQSPLPSIIPSEKPLIRALADIWQRLVRMSNSGWQKAFSASMRAIFDAALWQHELTEQDKKPLLHDYISKRQYLGAANVATDTIEITSRIKIKRQWYMHKDIFTLTVLARNTVCWANDLFSLSKELEHSDGFNLVLILMQEKGLTIDQAIAETLDIHDREVLQFIKIRENLRLPSGTEMDELNRYLNGLQYIMSANIVWSSNETTRYQFDYAFLEHQIK
jgi:hypothetical protein